MPRPIGRAAVPSTIARAVNARRRPIRSRAAKWLSVITDASGATSTKSRSIVMYGLYGSVSASAEVTLPLVAAKSSSPRTAHPALVPPSTAPRAYAAVSAVATGPSPQAAT
jgi:hypothetical protein